tara:strand:+ start:8026 stop:8514 length:489 start_codon:yes stop_codon:yes gene_type:complete
MDSGTLIIGLIILVICALPFILSGRNRITNEQNIKKAFFELAQKNNTSILQNDFWFKTAIGINTTSHQLFFYRKIKDNETSAIINLSEYQKCSIIKLNDGGNNIDIIQLVLVPNAAKKSKIILEFYNSRFTTMLDGENQLVDKWSKIINETIINTLKIKKVV